MAGRLWLAVALTAGIATAACRDLPAPAGGVLSLSRVIFPSPGVVAGDTLRDSTGAVAPLRVIAFGVNGEPLDPQPVPAFIVGGGAHLVEDSLLVGNPAGAGTKAGVIVSVGAIQTLPESILVTLRPDTLVAADSMRHVRTWDFTGDTVINSAELNTIVQHIEGADTTGVDAVIVRYELISSPPSGGSGPSIQLMRGNVPSARDTTSGGGRASRVARLRIAAFSGELDSAVVRATASYRGAVLGSVEFTIVYQRQP